VRTLELILQRTVLGLLIALLTVYAGDYISVRVRSAGKTPGNPIDTIQLNPLYAIPQKSGKNDYMFGDPQSETCVHSLFPHYGYTPCWYLKRSAAKIISMFVSPAEKSRQDREFDPAPFRGMQAILGRIA
jgi:hypothetical protein